MTSVDNRRRIDGLSGPTASTALSDHLQRVLVDLIELHLLGKQAHWNLVGTNFRDLHLQLDELVEYAREASDVVAERMRALNAVPDGRSDRVADTTSLPPFPAGEIDTAAAVDVVTVGIYAAADTVRSVRQPVEAEDASTADVLDQIVVELEKQAWLIKSETRKS